MPKHIRVVIADDHPIILAGYQHLLEDDTDIEVIATTGSARTAVELCIEKQPDILILDLGLPKDSGDDTTHSLEGVDVMRQLEQNGVKTRVLIATMLDKSPIPQRVLQAGAAGYLVKTEAADELTSAIRTLASGGQYISPSVAAELSKDSEAISRIENLSKRELEIFLLLASGLPAVTIGNKTNLSPKTVHAHRANILRKLNLNNNSDLVRFALASGVIQQ